MVCLFWQTTPCRPTISSLSGTNEHCRPRQSPHNNGLITSAGRAPAHALGVAVSGIQLASIQAMALSELTKRSSVAAAAARASEATSLAEQYREVRAATVALCATLTPEDYVVQSMPDASPAKWHLAHTTWFFEEFVLQHASVTAAGTPYEFHDSSFRYLFNSYYNAVGPMHTRS